jgi:tetratricopeptide (TPR) repeat protein
MNEKFNTGYGINLRSSDKAETGKSQDSLDGGFERKKGIVKSIDKLLVFSLFMIFFGIPLFFTGLSFQGIVFEKQMYFYFWILIALVSWAARGAILGELKIRRTPLDIPIFVFWLIYLIATIFSIDKWHSFWGFFGDPSRGFMSVTALLVLYYLVLSNFSKERMKLMLTAIVTSGALVSLWSLIMFMGVDIIPENIKPFTPFNLIGTSAGLKLFLGAMIPLIMVVLFTMKTKESFLKKVLYYVLLLFIPINIFLTAIIYEKASALIILFGIGFFLLYVLSHIVRPKAKLTWIPMLAFVLAMIVVMVGQNDFARVNAPLEVSPNAKTSWEVAKGSLKENAVLGSGPATYGFNFSAFKPQEFNNNAFFELRFYQGTGLFFEAISTIGVLGTLAFMVVLIAFVNIAIYLVSKDKDKNKIYSLGLLTSVLIIIISSLIMRVEGTVIIIGGMLGTLAMGTMFWESGVDEKNINLSLKASPKFALTLAFIFIIISSGVAALFVYIGKAYVADIHAGAGLREGEVSEKSIGSMLKTISLNDKEGRYYSRVSQEFMVLANREALKPNENQRVEFIREAINNSISYGEKGVELMPHDALAISVLAQIYENAGLFAKDSLNNSLEAYNDILEVDPHNPIAPLKIGQIKITMAASQEDKDKREELVREAKASLEKSLEKKENLDVAYYYLSLTQSALGEQEEAINSMSNAVSLSANNVTYLFNLGRLYQNRNQDGDLENAKKIFEYILTVNPDEVNTNFALALLYEKMNKDDKAIERYQHIISLITGDSDQEVATREQLEKMINNVRAGISNEAVAGEAQPVEVVEEQPVVPQEEIDLIGEENNNLQENPVESTEVNN